MIRRLVVVAGGLSVLGAGAWFLYRAGPSLGGWSPGCVLQKTTGLHCAGCGMTRAGWHLMHGELLAAWRMNPVMVPLLPLVALGIGLELAAWVRGPARPTPRLRLGARGTILLLVVVLAFMVLRNLPWWPCTLLAPA